MFKCKQAHFHGLYSSVYKVLALRYQIYNNNDTTLTTRYYTDVYSAGQDVLRCGGNGDGGVCGGGDGGGGGDGWELPLKVQVTAGDGDGGGSWNGALGRGVGKVT